MPNIAINLADVKDDYASLPLGEYLGQIDKITHREPNKPGKFAQFMISFTVIDGDEMGRKGTQWLSLSPNALFRVKRWFELFGMGDEELIIDEDTNELAEPDLVGIQGVFAVTEDAKAPGGMRTELVEVSEDEVKVAVAVAEEAEEEAAEEEAERPALKRRAAPEAKAKRRTLR